MRKIGGLLAAVLFVLSCVYLVMGYYITDLAKNPLFILSIIYIIICIPGSVIASILKRSDMTWLAGLGLTFTVVLFILCTMTFAFNISNLLINQIISTLTYLVLLISYISILCHIENTNISVSIAKAISVILATIFSIIIIWGFWGLRELDIMNIFIFNSTSLVIMLMGSIVFGVLSLILSIAFYGGEKVESDVIKLGRVDGPQVIANNIVNNPNINNNPSSNINTNNNLNVQPQPYQVAGNNIVSNNNDVNDISQIINPNPNPTPNEIPVMTNNSIVEPTVVNPNINNPVAVPVVNNNNYNSSPNMNNGQSNIVNIPLNFMNNGYSSLNNVRNQSTGVNNNVPPVVNVNQNMGMNNQPYNPNNIQNR